MLTPREIRDIAILMQATQDEARQIEPFTSRIQGFDLESAYAVAHRIHETRILEGAVSVGRKIGFTNSEMWSTYGIRQPMWGYMYDNTVTRLNANRGTCSLNQFPEPKIEPEIVFHFRSAPPHESDLGAVLESIDWVAHAYEIVQSHFPDWKFQAADTVADCGLHGALLVGEPHAIEQLGPDPIATLETFSLSLSCNGVVRELGKGTNVLGNPLASLVHLIEVLSNQPQYSPLQANEMVTTGTITRAQPIRPGEIWHTTLEGIALPGLTVELIL